MLTSGFYNAHLVDGTPDRLYDAQEFGAIFDGLINDGVYMGIGNHFRVTPSSGLTIHVGSGRGWFNHTWILNTSTLELTLDQAEMALSRIDAVVIDVNSEDKYRRNTIAIVKGTKSSTPEKPVLANDEFHHQYPLAYIRLAPGTTTIAANNIENAIGTSACPFVTGIIQTITVDDLIARWEVEWNDKMASEEAEFNQWFDTVKGKLDGDAAGHLTNELAWTNYTIYASKWSTSTVKTLGDGVSYYTYEIPVNNVYADVPQIDRAPSGENKVQTSDEVSSFNHITPPNGWGIIDTDAKKLTLYAKSKPTSDFVIRVQGVN